MGVIAIAGGASVFSSASGGKVYALTIAASGGSDVAPENPSRQRITFHNPGSNRILVGPKKKVGLFSQTQSDNLFSWVAGSEGGAFIVYADGGTLEITGECQGAWHAIAETGETNPFTVMDSNIG